MPAKKAPPPIPQRSQVQAKALYDFDAEDDDELDFKEGDVMSIVDQEDPNWWDAELNGRKGKVPSNYLEIVKRGNAPSAPLPPRDTGVAKAGGGAVGRGRGMGIPPGALRGRGRG